MKSSIEEFNSDSSSSFDFSNGAKVAEFGLNTETEFVAGLNTDSLIFSFINTPLNEFFEKVFGTPIDVSELDDLVFHFVSLRTQKNKGNDFKNADDFSYKIDLGAGIEYLIPTGNELNNVTLDISAVNSIPRIRITALHSTDDYIILSHMVAVKDEIPVDIFRGIKERLNEDIKNDFSDGIQIATSFSGQAGGDQVNIDGEFLEKYAVIKIVEGANIETHQLWENNETNFSFTERFDGKVLLNTYSNATIFLQFPIDFGMDEKEINLPGISIWGITPEGILRGSKLELERDSFKPDRTVNERQQGHITQHSILLDCEARHGELIEKMSTIVRSFIAREKVFVNGKKINLLFAGAPTEINPDDSINEIPKIQYPLELELKEDLFPRVLLNNTTTINISATPRSL